MSVTDGHPPREKLDFDEDPRLFEIYLGELGQICNDSWSCIEKMRPNLEGKNGDTLEFFFYLRIFVFSVGRLVQFLWPARDQGQVGRRAAALRSKLNITKNWYISDTSFRNDIVHFDERLDHWCLNSPHRNLSRHNIMPRGAFGGTKFDQSGDHLECYFNDEHIAVFAGTEFDIQKAADDVGKLAKKIREVLAQLRLQ